MAIRITPDALDNFNAVISADGNVVAYTRLPTFDEAVDGQLYHDLYLFDRTTGVHTRVTVSDGSVNPYTDGTIGNVALSADGSKVAFVSDVPQLTGDDDDQIDQDIYIYDVASQSTVRLGADGALDDIIAELPRFTEVTMSADSSRIAFVAGDAYYSRADVFVYDLTTGAVERVSTPSLTPYAQIELSADGRHLFFRHAGDGGMFVRDLATGETAELPIYLETGGAEGDPMTGRFYAVSADGRFVTYTTLDDGSQQVAVYDRQSGTVEIVSRTDAGIAGNAASFNPAISADGRFVVFASDASNLAAGETRNRTDLFVHDRQTGETRLLSGSDAGVPPSPGSYSATISADGRTIVIETTHGLDGTDANERTDLYIVENPFIGETLPPNEAPVAVDDQFVVDEDSLSILDLLGNDHDPDAGDSLTIVRLDGLDADQGLARINADGTIGFTPGSAMQALATGETAIVSFDYTVRDKQGLESTASVSITVTGVNDAPVTNPDVVFVAEDATTQNLWSTLLANDFDADGPLTIVGVNTGSTLGRVSFDAATQTLTYTASSDAFDILMPGQTATDYFSYVVRDAAGVETAATVVMTITGQSEADGWNYGTPQADMLSGTDGNDRIRALGDNDRVDGGLGHDVIEGQAGNDTLIGGQGNDQLVGGTGRDSLFGGDGEDLLEGGSGDAVVDGGGGDDLAHLDFSAETAGLYFSVEDVRFGRTRTVADVAVRDIERIEFTGGSGDDEIWGGEGIDRIDGGAGNDRIYGMHNEGDQLFGGDGDDFLAAYNLQELHGGNGTDHGVLTFPFVSEAIVFSVADNLVGTVSVAGAKASGLESVTIYAGGYGDRLTGGALADILYGFGGNDRLVGEGGDDYLDGGDGFDLISGGTGRDTLVGGGGDDELSGGSGDALVDGGAGNDLARLDFSGETTALYAYFPTLGDTTVVAGVTISSVERIDFTGGSGDDEIWGTEGVDRIDGGAGNDRIYGMHSEGDVLLGGAGDDFLAAYNVQEMHGGDGIDHGVLTFPFVSESLVFSVADNLSGVVSARGARFSGLESLTVYSADLADRLTGGAFADQFYGFGGNDRLVGEGGDDYLDGGSGDDVLIGGAGRDELWGGGGNDELSGGSGDQTVDGGGGDDLARLDFSGETTSLYFSLDFANRYGSDSVAGVVVRNIERMDFRGGSGDDEIWGSEAVDRIDGGAGNDRIFGMHNDGDVLLGGDGDDFVASYGLQELHGGDGTDHGVLTFADTSDVLEFSVTDNLAGIVSIAGMRFSGFESLTVYADDRDDRLTGGALTDNLYGFGGNDRLVGEGGDDYLEGGDGNDVLIGGAGRDTLIGGSGDDELWGDTPDQSLARSRMSPASVASRSFAASGGSLLDGGEGADTLHAIAGATLIGGAGVDTFVLDGSDAGATIADLTVGSGGDRIDVSALLVDSVDPVVSGQLRLEARDGGTALVFDADGAAGEGVGVDLALLQDVAPDALTSSNIVASTQGGTPIAIDLSPLRVIGGTSRSEALTGTAGRDAISGLAGHDVIRGAGGADRLDGGEGNDALFGEAGSDALIGGLGNDQLDGGEGADLLAGGAGADIVRGGAGEDRIAGGEGNDQLYGGTGADCFIVALDGSADTVRDFEAGIGAGDRLDLSALLDVHSFAELGDRLHANGAGHAVVELSNGTSVTLTGVAVGSLAANDFIFAAAGADAGHSALFASESVSLPEIEPTQLVA